MINPVTAIYLNAAIFVSATIIRIYKTKQIKLAESLLILYSASSVFSIFCYDLLPNTFQNITLFPFLWLIFVLFVSFSPILYFENKGSISYHLPTFYVNILACCLIALYVPSVLEKVTSFLTDSSGSFFQLDFFSERYVDVAELTKNQTGSSFQNILAILSSMFSEILVFVTFYYVINPQRNKWILIGLLISLFQPLLSSIFLASRTGMTYWLLNIVIAYFIFIPYYSQRTKKLVKSIITIVVVLMGSIFTLITISRFTTRGFDNYAGSSIIEYMGQPMLNFNNFVFNNEVYQYGDNSAPLGRKILGLEASNNLYERQAKWESKMKIRQGVFYTFIGDLSFDFGPIVAFIIIAICSWYVRSKTIIRNKLVPLSKLFLIFFWSCICFNGLFYFSYKTIGGNLKIITSILFYSLLVASYHFYYRKRFL